MNPGMSRDHHRLLAEPLGERPRELVGGVAGRQPADDLDETHERRRVHEVHADHPFGPGHPPRRWR
jgi:hypothetical protein